MGRINFENIESVNDRRERYLDLCRRSYIEAVATFRKDTGCSLAEAKNYIDNLRSSANVGGALGVDGTHWYGNTNTRHSSCSKDSLNTFSAGGCAVFIVGAVLSLMIALLSGGFWNSILMLFGSLIMGLIITAVSQHNSQKKVRDSSMSGLDNISDVSVETKENRFQRK